MPEVYTRRDFIKTVGIAAAGLAAPGLARAAETKSPTRIGNGANTYEWVEDWGQLPTGMKYGLGCGVVVDSKDRVYVTSRSANPCVAVFDKDGKLIETWSKEFAQPLIDKRKDVLYVPFQWQPIMFVIRNIPERIFKKLNL